jgi:catechol 2,3-dioxygenase-like lactoylglutathione lyase family enzyme
LDVIGLIVADLGRAIAFYERLGLQFPENPDAEGHGHVETTLQGGLRFTLDTEESIRSFDPGWVAPLPGTGRRSPSCVRPRTRSTASTRTSWSGGAQL